MDQPSWTCPHCGATSHNRTDAAEHYCGRCHHYCDDVGPPLGAAAASVATLAAALGFPLTPWQLRAVDVLFGQDPDTGEWAYQGVRPRPGSPSPRVP